MKKFFKYGFTLAEVLITLGIIGVVAALTIPALIQSYKKQVATVRLKKFYSTMEQAIKLSEIDNGPIESWKIEGVSSAHVKVFYETYLKPYLRVDNEDFEYNGGNGKKILIYLSDGSTFTLHNGDCIHFRYDVNGLKSPNVAGRDIFSFLICPAAGYTCIYGFSNNQPLKPYVIRSNITDNDSISRKKLLEQCGKNPDYCVGLLMYDNWEFKDDYPDKL